ncbi:MAG: glycosyltransferase [candidate division Zixibacteria bacterium]|nr:glycosyltransferase [candidate division Zixibacteria bacterium]
MKLFISIATYNESHNIEKLIRALYSLNLPELNVVIVDDNSPDGTSEIVVRLQSHFSSLHLIKRERKSGYGGAHVEGFRYALKKDADVVISMDADFSHNPVKIPEMLEEVKQGFDVVVGSRRVEQGKVIGWSLWRKCCSKGAMMLSKALLGIKTKDLTSGYRAYRREVLERINVEKILSNGYSFLEEMIYWVETAGFKVKEIPIVFRDRQFGKSKLSKWEILKFFVTIFKLKYLTIKLLHKEPKKASKKALLIDRD